MIDVSTLRIIPTRNDPHVRGITIGSDAHVTYWNEIRIMEIDQRVCQRVIAKTEREHILNPRNPEPTEVVASEIVLN